MMKRTVNLKILVTLFGLGMLATQPCARVVAVYLRTDSLLSAAVLREAVYSIRDNAGFSLDDKNAWYVDLHDDSLLPEHSISPGVYAYFWSDAAFRFSENFKTQGTSMLFEVVGASEEIPNVAIDGKITSKKLYLTDLNTASLADGFLRLRYTLSGPGRCSVEAYGVNGQSLGHWEWHDAAAGNFERTFKLLQNANGTFFVRWKHGNVQVVRRINASGVRK